MSATSLSFGVTDLALAKARGADAHLSRRRLAKFFSFSGLFTGFFAWIVRRQAHQFADLSVWFKGAKAQLSSEREDGRLHASDELITELEKAERHIAKGREQMLSILKGQEASGQQNDFVDAVRAYVIAASDFQEALSDFRWAAMEADADADIEKGRVKSFTSLEELLADLNS
jgi:hypothetical protein